MDDVYFGLKVVFSHALTEFGDAVEVKRSWKERLFSRPWRPFKKVKVTFPVVPSDKFYIVEDKLVIHPETFETVKDY